MKDTIKACSNVIELSWRLFSRTIEAKYRKSFLGYFWMVFPAILITGGVSLASQSGIINPGNTVLPYPLFVFVGTVLWQTFAEAFDVPYQAFEGARTYLTRVYFPREAIILAQLYESVITTFIKFSLVILLIFIFSEISLRGIIFIFISFCGAGLLGLGIGAIFAPFTLLFADLYNSIKLFLGYGLFLTPALYAPGKEGVFSTIVYWNPISPLMVSAREAAAGITLSQSVGFTFVLGISFGLTIIGLALIRLSAPIIIERMLLGGR